MSDNLSQQEIPCQIQGNSPHEIRSCAASRSTRLSVDTIRVFAISKIEWIRQQQAKLRGQEREARRECLERESHNLWGKRYLLKVVEEETVQRVELGSRRKRLTSRGTVRTTPIRPVTAVAPVSSLRQVRLSFWWFKPTRTWAWTEGSPAKRATGRLSFRVAKRRTNPRLLASRQSGPRRRLGSADEK